MALLVGRSPLSSSDTRLSGPQPARTQTLCRSCGHRTVANSVVEQSQRRHKPADYFQSLKWDQAGLVPVIVQKSQQQTRDGYYKSGDLNNGAILMQAYSDKAGILETLETGLATFYSRSRAGRWCKGETSNNYIRVKRVLVDCDNDSLIYLGHPDGPACHTGADTCYFKEIELSDGDLLEHSAEKGTRLAPTW